MSDYSPFKQAADALRACSEECGYGKLKAGHAHQIVAAAYGFGSQAAMKADGWGLYPDDPESYPDPDAASIQQRMEALGLAPDFARDAAYTIRRAVTPACSYCGHQLPTRPVLGSEPQCWICDSCVSPDNEVGHCWCCGEEEVYDASVLNGANECPEHAGESEPLDEEEAEDRDSFVEYWLNHEPD